MTSDFYVPVESAIQEFSEHLMCHPRTILSAKYGDGKSFFLDAFVKDKAVKKRFKFITIYPVNYQVLENQDVFDVIKYDILLQMGLNDMLDESVDISARDAFLFCMKTQGLDLTESLFNVAGSIEGAPKVKAIGKIGSALTKVVQKIKEAVAEYKEYKAGDLGVLDKYVEKIDKLPAYEEDSVTKIIQNGIASWRKRNRNGKKRVVLLFEDMDRIDPAHLFRILNIFSAHMDFSYRYGNKPNNSLFGNKFGVDNVVMVIHYENLESIFHHFYGVDTCFEGYIHKFADKGKFVYSLKEEAIKYYYKSLHNVTGIEEESLKRILNDNRLQLKTLRDLGNSLDEVRQQCKEVNGIIVDIAALMACMRRLGIGDHEIVRSFNRALSDDIKTWLKYLYPYLIHFNLLKGSSVYIKESDGKQYCYEFEVYNNSVNVHTAIYYGDAPFSDLNDYLYKILSLVIK